MSFLSLASNPNLANPAIIKIADEAAAQAVAKELQFASFPMKDYQIENINADVVSSLSGAGAGSLTVDGQVFADEVLYDGYNVTIASRLYTKKLEVGMNWMYQMERKSKASVMKFTDGVKANLQGLFLNKEQDFAKLFYLGQGTTFFTGGDGLALISASHTVKKPGASVQSNLVTVGAVSNPVLAPESLKQAVYQLDRMRDNADVLLGGAMRPCLVVARKNAEFAYQLVESMYGPATSNLGLSQVSREMMARLNKKLEVKVLDHIPDAYADYWFVVDLDRMSSQVYAAKAWEPKLHPELTTLNASTVLLFSTQFGFTPADWRWIVGSTGANAL